MWRGAVCTNRCAALKPIAREYRHFHVRSVRERTMLLGRRTGVWIGLLIPHKNRHRTGEKEPHLHTVR